MNKKLVAVRLLLTGGILSAGLAACGDPEAFVGEELSEELAYGGTSVSLPGRVEAENYDQGGSGVGYLDTTTGNSGAKYRTDNVDIETCSAGGYDVGWIAAGEWLSYGVKTTTGGQFDLTLSVASLSAGGKFHIEVGGVNVSGTITFASTGGWQNWAKVVVPKVTLPAGESVVRFVSEAASFNLDWLEFAAVTQTPYGGTAVALPGRVQAENYDLGGVDVAFKDSTAGNAGALYRTDDVDLEVSSQGGYNVGWVTSGEWLEYTVNVATAGTYPVTFSVASQTTGGKLHLESNGVNLTGTVSFTASGNWQTWKTAVAPSVMLPAGVSVLRLVSEGADFNLDWFEVGTSTPTCVPACSGKTCGSDGCGGVCGTCATGSTCSTSGQCQSSGDGILSIVGLKENDHGAQYTSGRLNSTYSVPNDAGTFVEARMKMALKRCTNSDPYVNGTWPTIWMLGSDEPSYGGNVSWPGCGEIDIIEWLGKDNDSRYQTNQWGSPNFTVSHNSPGFVYYKSGAGPEEWHNYGVRFNGDTITFTFDGVNQGTKTYNDADSHSHRIILNMALGGDMGGTIASDFTSDTMQVDWVRVTNSSGAILWQDEMTSEATTKSKWTPFIGTAYNNEVQYYTNWEADNFKWHTNYSLGECN
jgi:hypothetical protein